MENGLQKEKREVETLVKYLDNMEEQLGQVLMELKEVKEQLYQIEIYRLICGISRCLDIGFRKMFLLIYPSFLPSPLRCAPLPAHT